MQQVSHLFYTAIDANMLFQTDEYNVAYSASICIGTSVAISEVMHLYWYTLYLAACTWGWLTAVHIKCMDTWNGPIPVRF